MKHWSRHREKQFGLQFYAFIILEMPSTNTAHQLLGTVVWELRQLNNCFHTFAFPQEQHIELATLLCMKLKELTYLL